MKVKDYILAGMITLNLFLAVFLAAVVFAQTESVAHAGVSTDRAGFVRSCTMIIGDNREGLVVIDTLANKLAFYTRTQGRREIVRTGSTIDLARAFNHPK